MSRIDLKGMMDEIVWFLRNNLTDPESRGSSATYTGTATDGQTVITISVAGIKAITSVTIGGALKTFGTDYSVSISAASAAVTMASGMTAGQSISIPYKKGETWIYADWPRADLSYESYPRVAALWSNIITTPSGLGAGGNFNDITISITVFAKDADVVMDLIDEMRDDFSSNKKSFYNFGYIDLSGVGPMLTTPDRKGEIVQCAADFRIPIKYEDNA